MKRPDWDNYFLNIAKEVARRGTCLRRCYGAVIVNGGRIVSAGYNGAPCGTPNCIDIGTCKREDLGVPQGQRYDLCRAVHAEMNAIINCDPLAMQGAVLYIAGIDTKTNEEVVGLPCSLCRGVIRNTGIEDVVCRDAEGVIFLNPSELR